MNKICFFTSNYSETLQKPSTGVHQTLQRENIRLLIIPHLQRATGELECAAGWFFCLHKELFPNKKTNHNQCKANILCSLYSVICQLWQDFDLNIHDSKEMTRDKCPQQESNQGSFTCRCLPDCRLTWTHLSVSSDCRRFLLHFNKTEGALDCGE